MDHIIEVKKIGPGALLYKVDINRAFRHIRIDHGNIDLLGLHHRHTFRDGSMPFGYHLRAGIFENSSNEVRYIMKKHGHNTLLNYIDDLIYIGLPSKMHDSYRFLLSLLQDLGLQVSHSKLVPVKGYLFGCISQYHFKNHVNSTWKNGRDTTYVYKMDF